MVRRADLSGPPGTEAAQGARADEAQAAAPTRLLRQAEGALAIGLALAAGVALAFVGIESLWAATPRDPRAYPAVGHLAFLLFSIASTVWVGVRHTASLDPLLTTSLERAVVRRSMVQILRAWLGVQVSWLALYAWLAFGYYRDGLPAGFDSVSDALNIASVFGWAFLGLVLDRPSTPTSTSSDRHLHFQRALFWAAVGCVFALGLSVGGRALESDARFSGLGAFGSGVVGVAVSVAMAFFFSGLSHGRWLFGLAHWPLVLLWSYCALQLCWSTGVVGESRVMGLSPLALLWLALGLKAYLFAYVTSWLRSGMLEQLLLRLQRELE